MKRFVVLVGAAALGLSALTACGGDETPAGAGSTGAALAVKDVTGLGEVVVDGTERTVYVFDNDTASPSKSNCDGDCAAKWPPVPAVDGSPKLEGIDASLVGTVTRTDGSKQLTLGGLPVYLFAQDGKAGEAKGQAVGGVWWVVGADGKKITKQASDSGEPGY